MLRNRRITLLRPMAEPEFERFRILKDSYNVKQLASNTTRAEILRRYYKLYNKYDKDLNKLLNSRINEFTESGLKSFEESFLIINTLISEREKKIKESNKNSGLYKDRVKAYKKEIRILRDALQVVSHLNHKIEKIEDDKQKKINWLTKKYNYLSQDNKSKFKLNKWISWNLSKIAEFIEIPNSSEWLARKLKNEKDPFKLLIKMVNETEYDLRRLRFSNPRRRWSNPFK